MDLKFPVKASSWTDNECHEFNQYKILNQPSNQG